MILDARTRETIRAALLSRLAARFDAGDAPLDIRDPGDAYQMTDALAVLLSALEGQAAGALSQILPDRATGPWLDAHGDAPPLPREAGELDADYQARILAWWAYRHPTGSPADLVAACEATDVVVEAYAYPSNGSGAVRGLCDVRVMGAAQGESAADTRILSNADLAHVRAYIEGDEDAHGTSTPGGEQRRIVGAKMTAAGNVEIYNPTAVAQDVTLAVANAPTPPWPWTGSHGIASSNTISWTVSGDQTALTGLPWLLFVGTSNARGGYMRVTPPTATFNSGPNTTKFDAPTTLPAAPTGTGYPAPPNWEEIRDAVFGVFDALTPGDTSPATRYPAPTGARPTKLYLGGLYAAIEGADGVVDSSISTPAATVTPGALELLKLGTLTITKLP